MKTSIVILTLLYGLSIFMSCIGIFDMITTGLTDVLFGNDCFIFYKGKLTNQDCILDFAKAFIFTLVMIITMKISKYYLFMKMKSS